MLTAHQRQFALLSICTIFVHIHDISTQVESNRAGREEYEAAATAHTRPEELPAAVTRGSF